MSLEFALRPSSIEGIKRLADRIEREESIKRAEALERASRSDHPAPRHLPGRVPRGLNSHRLAVTGGGLRRRRL